MHGINVWNMIANIKVNHAVRQSYLHLHLLDQCFIGQADVVVSDSMVVYTVLNKHACVIWPYNTIQCVLANIVQSKSCCVLFLYQRS